MRGGLNPWMRDLQARRADCASTRYNVDAPQKHYTAGRKPDTKDHLWYDSIHMKSPEEVNLQRQKVNEWLPRTGMGMGTDCKPAGGDFGGSWKCFNTGVWCAAVGLSQCTRNH